MRSVIFDCDGVLVDTELIANRVLAGLLTEAGLPTTVEDSMRDYRGRAMRSNLKIAARRLGRPLPEDIADRYYAEIEEIFARELEPVPGVVEALERIDLPSCVASSGPHHKMEVTLRSAGLWDRFNGRIFSASEVAHGKPAPDLFLHAAQRMGFDPATTAVVEDSVYGIEAARAAGMRALAFARHTPADVLAAAGGDPFTDMTALPELLGCGR
ncbi:MAG: HAD family hydrolase [Actinomycetota bacterium]|nr:HAD family hydrolase [Actinomycetota bacterium]